MKFALSNSQLVYRYGAGGRRNIIVPADVGGAVCTSWIQLIHSLKAPGFHPWAYEVKTWFQSLGFHIQLVPLLVGYADVGESEIPPGATFKLEVELLEVRSSST
jgi:hypothetical protein